ncbi:MAG: hypothetical protein ABR532_03920 [Candidatus Dormibacteria bacterium]
MRRAPLDALVRGALAGAIGTAIMDLGWFLKHRAQGGQEGLLSFQFGGPSLWEEVPAPAQVGKRLYEGFRQRPLDERWARTTNNVMHWGYGMGWGALFGVIAGSVRVPRLLGGSAFGTAVWGSSYVLMPIAGLYKPIWTYRPAELAPDLAAHIAYGVGTAVAFGTIPPR